MTPVEIMAVAQDRKIAGSRCVPSIENAVACIHRPSYEGDQQQNPRRKLNADSPCESPGPYQGYGWRIQAGEVPESKDGRRFQTFAGRAMKFDSFIQM